MDLYNAINLARDWSKATINPHRNACVIRIAPKHYQVSARAFVADKSKIVAIFGAKKKEVR